MSDDYRSRIWIYGLIICMVNIVATGCSRFAGSRPDNQRLGWRDFLSVAYDSIQPNDDDDEQLSGDGKFDKIRLTSRMESTPIAQSQRPLIAPTNERLWRADLAVLPFAEFDAEKVTIHNIRNCRYRSENEFDVRHYDMSFTLDSVKTVDFIIVPFQNAPMLAHTMLSFGLEDQRHFIVSVEARLEKGETYTPTKGSTNQYELMYVIGDEQDLIPLRTEVRQVDVYLYPGNAPPNLVQDLLVDMLNRANKIYREPEFYDTLTNNCTTNLVRHVNRLRPGRIPLDPRIWLPGHSDKLAYDLGLLKVTGTIQEMRLRSKINTRTHLAVGNPEFSKLIRQL